MIFFLSFTLILVQILFAESPLSNRYHTYEEIDSVLHAWNEQFGLSAENSPYAPYGSGIVYKLMEIGTSTQDELPFWAVKLSFSADVDEDEPRTLILGQCHSEEILGIEIVMDIMYMFLHPDEFETELQTLIGILYSSEVWIVPTYNPEGLSVVHGYEEEGEWLQDVSYRKNKMDANHNGAFDFDINGYGNDIDGVDLNRNYGFNWIFGDEFLETDSGCPSNPSYVSNYDYYRGEGPFSEDETAAIRDLALEYDFMLSIAYHSSRSGCVAERVIYPWAWGSLKTSPDFSVIQPLGQKIAELTSSESGSGNYHFAASSSPKGNAHDWFYKETGCIQYLIEVGTSNMQPNDVNLIEDTIARNLPGAFHVMKRAAGINSQNGPDKYQVTGIVSDSQTGNPIEGVEVIVSSMHGTVLTPRLTDHHGRYRRLLVADSYDLLFRRFGYEDYVHAGYIPSAEIVYPLDISLTPKEYSELTINVSVPGSLEGPIVVSLNDIEYAANGNQLVLSLPNGNYDLEVSSDEIFPHLQGISLTDDLVLSIPLHRYNIVYDEDFMDLDRWEILFGDWVASDGRMLSQEDLVYSNWSPSGNLKIVSLDDFSMLYPDALIQLEMKYEVEWDHDSLLVDLISDSGNNRIFTRYNQNWEDRLYNIPINSSLDSDWRVGFEISRDLTIGYRGVSVNSFRILESCVAGDANHDASLDVTDIVLLVAIVLGDSSSLDYLACNVDANTDGLVDILDIIRSLNIILGD